MAHFSAVQKASQVIPADAALTDIVCPTQLAKYIALAFNVNSSLDQMDDECQRLPIPDMPKHSRDALDAGELSPAVFTFFATQWVASVLNYSTFPSIDEIDWLSDTPAADQFRELFNEGSLDEDTIWRAKSFCHPFIQWVFCDDVFYTPEVANRISAAVNAAQAHIKATNS